MMIKSFLLGLFITCSTLVFTQEVTHNHSIHHAFIENKGQWDKDILFKSNFDGGNLWVQRKKLMFHLQDFSQMNEIHVAKKDIEGDLSVDQLVMHVNFVGANEIQSIDKSHQSKEYYNYFIGNDESKWASGVHGYGEATLNELYKGIDLKLIEELEQLKYEFHVNPGGNPNQIKLAYAGHESLRVDNNGNLIANTRLGEIIEHKPYAYQIVNGNIREVECSFQVEDDNVSFNLGEYNPNVILIIDPVLVFATYCGSTTDNFGMTATYGYDGTAYSGGTVYGNTYPTPDNNAYDITSNFTVQAGAYGITDVFISKYNPTGTSMIWTTFLGGGNNNDGTEVPHSIICDTSNNVYVYGSTSSTDFPMVGGYQTTHAGGTAGSNFTYNGVYFNNQGTDIYVAKISANGQNLMASTYVGGSQNDGVNYKLSSGIYNNVAAYDSLTLNYGDQFRGEIMLDSLGNCLVASCTRSTDFPTLSPFQASNAGGQDGVIFKLNSTLSALQWSSYYGGSDNDACYSVKIDSSFNIVFAGGTSSNNLPGVAGGWQSTYNGGKADGFVGKLNSSGTTLANATYLGTSNYDQAFFVEIDRTDDVFILGQSEGGQFPVINAGFSVPNSSQFVIELNPTLNGAVRSTVFGNGSPGINISPAAFLVDICGNIYISGWGANILQSTPLSGMPVTSDAFQLTPPNGFDFYLLVIERDMMDTLYGSYLGGGSAQEHVDGGTSRFDKNGVVYQSVCGGCGGNSDFPTTSGAWSANNLSSNCNNLVFKFDFDLIPKAEFTVDNSLGCAPFTVTFDNFSSASDSYLWDFGNGDTTSVIFEPVITYDTAGIYTVFLYVTDSVCLLTDTAEITIYVYDSLELNTIPDQELCVPTSIDFIAYTNGSADQFIWSSNPNFTDTLNANINDSIFTTTPQTPGVYYVQVSNSGCSLIDSVTVDFIGSSLTLSGNTSLCLGESTLITATNSNPSITFTYSWAPDSIIPVSSNTNSVTVTPSVTQYVYVTASSSTGCVVTDSILVNVSSIPDNLVNAYASDYYFPTGSEITLYGEPSGYSYLWTPPTGLSNPTAQQTQAIIDNETVFTLYISDGICTKSDTVHVKPYDFVCDNPFVFVPNAFSPNGDGENEILYVRGALIKEMVFRVYDRWGELVFESFDRSTGWNGEFRGKLMDPDVYDYYLQVTCIDDVETIIKGNVTLLR